MSVTSHQLTRVIEVVSLDTKLEPISLQTTRPGISLANACKVNSVSGSSNRFRYRLNHKNPVKIGLTTGKTPEAYGTLILVLVFV
jgi:hypothetical protein